MKFIPMIPFLVFLLVNCKTSQDSQALMDSEDSAQPRSAPEGCFFVQTQSESTTPLSGTSMVCLSQTPMSREGEYFVGFNLGSTRNVVGIYLRKSPDNCDGCVQFVGEVQERQAILEVGRRNDDTYWMQLKHPEWTHSFEISKAHTHPLVGCYRIQQLSETATLNGSDISGADRMCVDFSEQSPTTPYQVQFYEGEAAMGSALHGLNAHSHWCILCYIIQGEGTGVTLRGGSILENGRVVGEDTKVSVFEGDSLGRRGRRRQVSTGLFKVIGINWENYISSR